ncbi:MAG: glycosyltransferase family 2 protein [Anaerolineae bacterium]|nr:glycosyltransferase family 2 protein [Anaerolineae bacterium]
MTISNVPKAVEHNPLNLSQVDKATHHARSQLAIVILNWNAADDTLACIRHLTAFKQLQPHIWVVDNASLDGSPDQIAAEFPQVHLIRNATNLGYAAGNNRALAEILERPFDFILLLNNDALIDEANLQQLTDALQQYPEVGIVGPIMHDASAPERFLNAGGQNPVLHLTSHVSRLSQHAPLQLVDYVPGTVMLLRGEVVEKTGLLDERYFFSAEIPDFCRRARQHGYLSAAVTGARAYHTIERSSAYRKALYVYYIIRNRFLFIRKFYPKAKGILFGFWMLYSLALSTKLHLEGQRTTTKAVMMGLSDGIRGRFGGQNERVLAACDEPAPYPPHKTL